MPVTTNVKCTSCKKGNVVSNVLNVPKYSSHEMPFGPVNEQYYTIVVKFWCDECGQKYKHPPGQPNKASELIRKERRRFSEVQENW